MLAKLSERIKPSITCIFTVLVHALDWLNALSSFKTVLAVRQLEKICNDHALKWSENCGCLWILAVVKASLDVVMSVAASVILSLLLISGDVEENPGPGGNNNSLFLWCIYSYLHVILRFCFTDLDYNAVDSEKLLS